jgi:hypothetical protein
MGFSKKSVEAMGFSRKSVEAMGFSPLERTRG